MKLKYAYLCVSCTEISDCAPKGVCQVCGSEAVYPLARALAPDPAAFLPKPKTSITRVLRDWCLVIAAIAVTGAVGWVVDEMPEPEVRSRVESLELSPDYQPSTLNYRLFCRFGQVAIVGFNGKPVCAREV